MQKKLIKKIINFYVSQIEFINSIKEKKGISMANYVRNAVDAAIKIDETSNILEIPDVKIMKEK